MTLRPIVPFSGWNLSPKLGLPLDSLVRTPRGIYYQDVQPGDGPQVGEGDSVAVHFVGQLADATIFSATDREPFRFRVGAGTVIPGWDAGVRGMRIGGRRRLLVPPHLGYGPKGAGAVPPDAVLIFDLTLVDLRR